MTSLAAGLPRATLPTPDGVTRRRAAVGGLERPGRGRRRSGPPRARRSLRRHAPARVQRDHARERAEVGPDPPGPAQVALRSRGPAGRVRGGPPAARPRPHARLAPPAPWLAHAGPVPTRGGSGARLPCRDPRRTLRGAHRRVGRGQRGGRRRRPPAAQHLFLRACGAGYIAEAFRLAHAADPGARLYYNDYGAEGRGPKSDAVYALVRRLLDEGVPVHGVGLQMHLRATRPPEPAAIAANVARSGRSASRSGSRRWTCGSAGSAGATPWRASAASTSDAIAACVAISGFTGVTFWGVNDTHSWIHREFGKDAPLLFDRRLRAEARLLRRARRAGHASDGRVVRYDHADGPQDRSDTACLACTTSANT